MTPEGRRDQLAVRGPRLGGPSDFRAFLRLPASPALSPVPSEVTQARRGSLCPVTASLSQLHKEKICKRWETASPHGKGRAPKVRPRCMDSEGRPDHSLFSPQESSERESVEMLAGVCQGHLRVARGQDWGEPKGVALPQVRCWAQ